MVFRAQRETPLDMGMQFVPPVRSTDPVYPEGRFTHSMEQKDGEGTIEEKPTLAIAARRYSVLYPTGSLYTRNWQFSAPMLMQET
jgi:hypothetical protein